MAAPYSNDLRRRVLSAYDRGMQTKQIAEDLQVSPAWARRVKQRRREHGELTPRAMGGKRFEKIDRLKLAALVRQQPDATLAELRQGLGITCAVSAISMTLRAMSLSFKKRRSTRPNRIVRTWRRGGPTGSWRGPALIRVG